MTDSLLITNAFIDDDRDILYLVKRTSSGKWITEEHVNITQTKIDLAEFDIDSPLTRLELHCNPRLPHD
jgi:hypothetical protein